MPLHRIPKQCPVCGNTSLRSNQMILKFEDEPISDPGVVTYRCENEHIFYIEATKRAARH